METQVRERSGQIVYRVHDLFSVPEDVPALGIQRGDEGIIRELVLHNDGITAFVQICYSTGRGVGSWWKSCRKRR